MNYKIKRRNKMNELKSTGKTLLGSLIGILLLAWAFTYIWNGFLMEIVTLPKISFWQAYLIFIVVKGFQK
jgi:hypothetical protein